MKAVNIMFKQDTTEAEKRLIVANLLKHFERDPLFTEGLPTKKRPSVTRIDGSEWAVLNLETAYDLPDLSREAYVRVSRYCNVVFCAWEKRGFCWWGFRQSFLDRIGYEEAVA